MNNAGPVIPGPAFSMAPRPPTTENRPLKTEN